MTRNILTGAAVAALVAVAVAALFGLPPLAGRGGGGAAEDCSRLLRGGVPGDSGEGGYAAVKLEAVEPQPRLTEKCRGQAEREIQDGLARLVRARRLSLPHPEREQILVGQFRWFTSERGGAEGLYVYHQPSYDQAARSWFAGVTIREGDPTVYAPGVEFDSTAVGMRAYVAGYDGDSTLAAPSLYVLGVADPHRLVLSRPARSTAEGVYAKFTPPDYDENLCLCMLPGRIGN